MRLKRLALLTILLVLVIPVHAQETPVIGPDTFPDGVSHLTGLMVETPELLERRPLNIKISNNPAVVRPQSGLNAADIVWEHLVEGGVTRFTAIFQSQAVPHLGPVRSARLVDIELTRIYGSLFVHSGSSMGTLERLRQDAVMPMRNFGGGGCPPLCRFPKEGVAFEHTLFGDTEALYTEAQKLGLDTTPDPIAGLAFSPMPPANGTPVNGITIAYRHTEVTWAYESGRWLRSQDGEPHFDAITKTQINAANLVVIETDHIEQPMVSDGYWGTANYAFEVNLVGSGHIYLFRDGQYFEGEWRRKNDTAPLYFFDMQGNVLPFKPGNTFFNLVPRWTNGYQLTFALANPIPAAINQDSVILRAGPDAGYGQQAAATRSDTLMLVGRNWAGDWVQAVYPDRRTAWVSTWLLDVGQANLQQLPAVRSTYEQ
ncbi:MAG TPA: DUF3048 domain-containing protein [Phototrophicaceae bacterium]|nr:DUF3048 domain-containing protein [Phototrophicaceae bacterium]